ncbi:MAG: NAD(P)H-dependent oxidoreductase [candidate division Zixibacteria bacterium]|nr:NAD(P)H-dependent oxidoreductase [candidate division Zixibacteria bacterium]NIR65310.1 NAD(P)H-dependent oxidoreductase [candidate division Zixibacteria bacterium]NIS16676.1 NAD(P)H-dependent oxidoreductase [candidate division Zixibacteria bacterium]NIS47030.1 NAD(P)H-dependent oxidoreductase [candidate division Zixibacteria bacterium]NIT51478.1 NAD(P)H-dependent oxidoreductase [candidate division Zixibacteria bacterium]
MKVLIVYGSPDGKGNSRRLADALNQGLRADRTEIEEINIYDYNVTEVWSDYFSDALQNNFKRAGEDDMSGLIDKMSASDIIILVSPVYWYQLGGKMKTFVDRWADTINTDFSTDLKGKGLALVTTHSGLNVMNSSNYLQLAMEATARFMGMIWMGAVDAPTALPISSGPIDAHYQIAKNFGEKLSRGENLIGQKVL